MNRATNRRRVNSLHRVAQFALFVSSYFPLFLLIIVRQISENYEYLTWGGLSWEGVKIFAAKFLLSAALGLLSTIGLLGCYFTLKNIEADAPNGYPVTVKDVKNKNSEAIGYVATYLIPFLFQGFEGWYECFSVLFLLFIIYRIYINSSLLLINPILSFYYAIYEVEYSENDKSRNGLIITKNKYLQDDESIKIYEIGPKLYFAIDNE